MNHSFHARTTLRAAAFAAALVSLPYTSHAQHDHSNHSAPATASSRAPLLEGMGSWHHPITTSNPLAQRYFDQGLSLAYAFNHAEAKRSFLEAARLDPSCAMCWWGVAYVLGPNINAPMDPAVAAEALDASGRALDLAGRASPHERDYIRAMTRRYSARPGATRASLDSAFAAAMAEVAQRWPDDADASVIFAEGAMTLSPWVYWSKDRAPLPGTAAFVSALEHAMTIAPDNPGACHFFIHAVESVFPQRAVACAEQLAALMPGAGHIVHMPAHIYLRVGRWNDAIAANEHAVHADESYIADQRAQSLYTVAYYPHNYHFLAFAATMAGRGGKALDAARSAAGNTQSDIARDALDLQLLVAYPHVTLATFGRWDELLSEPMPRGDLRLATGLAWYARGLAFAAAGERDAASAALDSVRAAKRGLPEHPLAKVLEVADRVLAAELASTKRNHAAAVALLGEAVAIEDGFTYMEPPYWHQPVRHRLGAALLALGRSRDAEARFREDLARFPENVWSLRGLEQSLIAQGRDKEARDVRARFDVATREADAP